MVQSVRAGVLDQRCWQIKAAAYKRSEVSVRKVTGRPVASILDQGQWCCTMKLLLCVVVVEHSRRDRCRRGRRLVVVEVDDEEDANLLKT